MVEHRAARATLPVLAQSASKKENVPRYRLCVYRLRSHAGGFKRLRAVEEIVLTDD